MFDNKLSRQQVEYFAGRLASYVRRGHKIQRALETLATNSNRNISKAAKKVLGYMVAGALPDAAFEKAGMFPRELVSVVRAGMKSPDGGRLYLELANTISYSSKIRGEVLGMLKLPFIYLLMLIGMAVVMTTTVLPTFIEDPADAEGSAILLLAIRDFLIGMPVAAFLVGGIMIAGLVYTLLKVDSVRVRVEHALIRVPLVGTMLLQMEVARATAYLGLLLNTDKSGKIPFELTSKTVSLIIVRDAIIKWSELSMVTDMLNAFDSSSDIWPSDLRDTIESGVSSGALPEELSDYSALLREEILATIGIVKPTLSFIAVVGAAVGMGVLFLDGFIGPMMDRVTSI